MRARPVDSSHSRLMPFLFPGRNGTGHLVPVSNPPMSRCTIRCLSKSRCSMSKPVRLALWSLCLTAALLSQAPAQTAAAELDLGVAAYKRAKYDEAIQHFQKAVSLDPTLQQAHLYLGTAFAQQYIPGADTSDNNKMAAQAIAHYKDVLQLD